MALSDVAIRSAKSREKPYKMGDSLGLFLLVQPSGGKLWRLKYRVDGREKKLGLGNYPEIGLSDARRRRDEARSLIADGEGPFARKTAREGPLTPRGRQYLWCYCRRVLSQAMTRWRARLGYCHGHAE